MSNQGLWGVPKDMSDEDAPAARGGFGGRARRHVDRDDDRHRSCWRKSDFPLEDAFKGCRVKVHEDVPRHIHRLFRSWMPSTMTRSCLSLLSKTRAPASFDATTTAGTLSVVTILAPRVAQAPPPTRPARRSPNRGLMLSLLFFATSSTTMVSSL